MPPTKRKSAEQKRLNNKLQKQKSRENIILRRTELEKNANRIRYARQNQDFREAEKTTNRIIKQRSRRKPLYRNAERIVDSLRKQAKRRNRAQRIAEQNTNTTKRQSARQNLFNRNKEQRASNKRRKTARHDPVYRASLQTKDTLRRSKRRQNPLYRCNEQTADTRRRRAARTLAKYKKISTNVENPIVTRKKNLLDRKRKLQPKNIHPAKRTKVCSTPNQDGIQTCDESSNSSNTLFNSFQSGQQDSYEAKLKAFNDSIRDTPTNVCSCCGGLFYKHSMQATSKDALLNHSSKSPNITLAFLNTVLVLMPDNPALCSTCYKHVKNGKVPSLCLSNGHDFAPVPEVIKTLSPLEERLVALRLPFMKIRNVGFEGQAKLKGNIINIENDLDVCAKVIPRNFTETSTVQFQLMRRLAYSRPYMYETISPSKVYNASLFLQGTELYQMNNVEVRHDWADVEPHEQIEFIVDPLDSPAEEEGSIYQNGVETVQDNCDQEDQPLEQTELLDEEEELTSHLVDETLIYNECDYRVQGIRIAPGEGHHPLPLYSDEYCEEMAFPKIYVGRRKVFKPNCRITYTQRAKSEIRNRDRRACRPDHVLYMFRRSYNEQVRKDVNIHLRKRRRAEHIKAAQAKDPKFLQTLIANDEGYAVWSNLRSSPSYWQAKSKKVLGMIRQLGNCSFFVTLSAAESKWSELLQLLHHILKEQRITENEAMNLSSEEKADLIKSDPVTCMRHFDYRMKQLMKLLLCPENGIFDDEILTDYFQRVEFQMRGSPHSHGLYWIKDAPVYKENDPASAEACINFIDKFITCKRDTDGEMEDVLPYQIHKHSDSCKKGLKKKEQSCRFSYPKLPMPNTTILNPLPKDYDVDKLKQAKLHHQQIQQYLISLGRNPENCCSFEDFLETLQLSYDEYILAARSSCRRNEVFLKRQVNEAWINAYNKKLLIAWKANMDIQFVLDSYACAKYCVGYIMKCDGGISKLFNQITLQSRKLQLSTQEKINQFAKALINGTEISAQEAAAYLLGLFNTFSSRDAIFINTGPPDERIRILKTKEELDLLDENSDDVCASGVIEHYQQRPLELEDICLADFATLYEFKKLKLNSTQSKTSSHNLVLLDKSGYLNPRQKRKILRFRNYSKTQYPEQWAREQCMLFLPFRNERLELCLSNCMDTLAEHLELINFNSKPYYANRDLDESTLQQLFQSAENDRIMSDSDSDSDNDDQEYNDQDFNNSSAPKIEGFMPPKHCPDDEYEQLMQNLNEKQRKFVLNVLHKLKTGDEPFHYFLSGGAGVGKSHAITAIVQSALRFYAKQRSEHPDQIPVIVSAPTGKAAFNIFGMTLHTTFHLRPNQAKYGPMPDLSPGVANTLRTILGSCKLIIIDEISMVSESMLYIIDRRLKQIFANNLDFGGKSVIVVGHLRQLRPCGGSYVFCDHQGIKNVLWEKFALYELDTIMRQRDELAFCKALNNMSEGCMDNEDIMLIRSREISDNVKPPENAIWLFKMNEDCAKHNKEVHEKLPGDGILVTAIDRVDGHATSAEIAYQLEQAKRYTVSESDGLPYQTYLKVGGEYFISTNIDVSDGLFNGSTGTLKFIELNEDNCVKRVWIKFPPCVVGEKKRKQAASRKLYDRRSGPLIERSWVPITWRKKTLTKQVSNTECKTRIVRKQIPLVACNGMTIAKSQGSSIQHVVVSDTGKRKLERSELYVACSRATSLEGLFINGTFKPPKKPEQNDRIQIEVDRLREKSFPFALQFLQDKQCDLKIYFHNIGSYLRHAQDLASDQSAMAADIIILTEPWLQENDSVYLEGYNIFVRENCSAQTKNSEGMIIFCKDTPGLLLKEIYKHKEGNSHCIIISICHQNRLIHACYKSPNYPKNIFYNKLQQMIRQNIADSILIGDFNDNVCGHLKQLFNEQGFRLITSENIPTTDNYTHIDGCYANFHSVAAWVHESYYSIHKPICCIITQ